jgi:GNAT superfamily N-acetyltransferase
LRQRTPSGGPGCGVSRPCVPANGDASVGWDTQTVNDRSSQAHIREAQSDEFPALRDIEFAADRLFASVGIGPFTNDETENHLELSALVLAAGKPPIGFVCVELVDEIPHIWQLAVHPDHGRQGIGRALVEAVCKWARTERFSAITLTTFRDVPWNAPFYESLGFVAMTNLTPGLSAIRAHEREIGDDDFGPRLAMCLAL